MPGWSTVDLDESTGGFVAAKQPARTRLAENKLISWKNRINKPPKAATGYTKSTARVNVG
jgi:hypothetical protein